MSPERPGGGARTGPRPAADGWRASDLPVAGRYAGDLPVPGAMRVAERVVAKIAAIAAADVDSVEGPPPRLAHVLRTRRRSARSTRQSGPPGASGPAGHHPSGLPEATAKVVDGAAWVSLTLAVVYPAPVAETAEAVRGRVRERVAALAGLPVARIDIQVPTLAGGAVAPRVR